MPNKLITINLPCVVHLFCEQFLAGLINFLAAQSSFCGSGYDQSSAWSGFLDLGMRIVLRMLGTIEVHSESIQNPLDRFRSLFSCYGNYGCHGNQFNTTW